MALIASSARSKEGIKKSHDLIEYIDKNWKVCVLSVEGGL